MAQKNNKKVAIAMSGGIDSSVAAFLLKQKGYQTFGLTMRLGAFTKRAIEKAKEAAKRIKIEHYVVDLEKEFKNKIIFPFCQNYFQGQTPNPCIWCNKEIKFGFLLEQAQKLGADYLATGHYARIKKVSSRYYLLKGKDKTRDQSYFLYRLNQKQLSKIIFPIGDLQKKQIKKIAQKNNLDLVKKESREICFIPNNYREFIKKNCQLSCQPGHIINKQGKILGKHQGISFYTIGQRKGLIKGQVEPLFVVKIDRKRNALIVGKESDLYEKELIAQNTNWVVKEPKYPLKVRAKIRYRHQPANAKIILCQVRPDKIKVEFKKPQRAITPGQSVVFYQKNKVLGGGIID